MKQNPNDPPLVELINSVPIEYVVDNGNNIIAVQGPWNDFARANEANKLTADAVIGTSLLAYISGNVTRQYWLEAMAKVRSDAVPMVLDYRCDSPELKRFMRIQISAEGEGKLRFANTLKRTEPQAVVIRCGYVRERGKHSLVRCSLCNQLLCRGQWREAGDLPAQPLSRKIQVTYGVCAACQSSPKPTPQQQGLPFPSRELT